MDYVTIITNNILNAMASSLNGEQLNQLRFILDLELSKADIKEQKNELALPIDNDKLLKEYIASMFVSGKSKGTIKRYKYMIDKFTEYVDKDFTKVTTNDIKYFLAIYKTQRHCTNTTVDGMRLCLSAFFGWLETQEYILRNPVKKVERIKRDTQRERQLYDYEIELLRQQCNNVRDRAIFEFVYSTGCRISEVINVKISEIDFTNKTALVHGKGNKDRYVPFSEGCLVYLREYLDGRKDNCEYLFKSMKQNKQLTIDGAECIFSKLGERANVNHVHPHRFRVTRITNLIDRGMAIQNVQQLVGHSDISTTEGYYRMNTNNMRYEFNKYCY